MQLVELKIYNHEKEIRTIRFRKGMNFILDTTRSPSDELITGNNVGKTTTLALIDYCLGGGAQNIYADSETKKNNEKVKEFLYDKKIIVSLSISSSVDDKNPEYILKRNFLNAKNKIMKINEVDFPNLDSYKNELKIILFPDFINPKPSFRQLIASKLRYKDERINNTIKFLNQNVTSFEYETLFLTLLGMPSEDSQDKDKIKKAINKELIYIKKLQSKQTKTEYETLLNATNKEISYLEDEKKSLKINENFLDDLTELNNCKYELNKNKREYSNLSIKLKLIEEVLEELRQQKTEIDTVELRDIYDETKKLNIAVSIEFEKLVTFHNEMIKNKSDYISAEVPDINNRMKELKGNIDKLLLVEEDLINETSKYVSYQDIEEIISKLNTSHTNKGEYETYINQITDSEKTYEILSKQMDSLNEKLHSEEYKANLQKQIGKFNEFYNSISNQLYGEKFYLKYEIGKDRKTEKEYYKFDAFNENFGNGKKQGEIIAFDLSLILFSIDINIATPKFILNDKKELMDIKQLEILTSLLKPFDIQLVISILSDKLSTCLIEQKLNVLVLNENDKLFRIEQYDKI